MFSCASVPHTRKGATEASRCDKSRLYLIYSITGASERVYSPVDGISSSSIAGVDRSIAFDREIVWKCEGKSKEIF